MLCELDYLVNPLALRANGYSSIMGLRAHNSCFYYGA